MMKIFLWQEFSALKSCHILSLCLLFTYFIYVFTVLNTGTVEGKEQSITNIPQINHK